MEKTPDEIILEQVEKIREDMKKHKLSDIAEATNLHVNTIYAIAHGRTTQPNINNLRAISNYLYRG